MSRSSAAGLVCILSAVSALLALVAGVALPAVLGILLLCAVPAAAMRPGLTTATAAAAAAAVAPLVAVHPVLPAVGALLTAGTVALAPTSTATPFAAGATLAVAVYATEPAALVVALLATVLLIASWRLVSAQSTKWSVAAAAVAAAAVLTFPALAAARDDASPALLAAVAGTSVVAMTALFVTVRSAAFPVRLASIAAATLLLSVSPGFAGSTDATSAAPEVSLLDQCVLLGGDTIKSVECYSQALIENYEAVGLQPTLTMVYDVYNMPPPLGSHFANNCHEALHFLGKAAALDADDMMDVIRQGTDMCAAGFGHGIWEIKYSLMSNDQLIAETPVICRGWEGTERSEEGSAGIGCRHILGHTLATRFRGDVAAVANVCLVRDPAIDATTEWSETEVQSRNNCLAGLFMENILDLTRFRPEDLDADNPFSVCSDPRILESDDIAWGCYNEIGALVVKANDFSVPEALRACKAHGETLQQISWVTEACYDSVSRAVAPSLEYEYDAMHDACVPVEETDLRAFCARGAASTYTFNSLDVAAGLQMCRSLLPSDPEGVEMCTKRVGEVQAVLAASQPTGDRAPAVD